MASFEVFSEAAGEPLLAMFGGDVEYRAKGQPAGPTIRAIVDYTPQLQDPYGQYGRSFQAGQTVGVWRKSDVPAPAKGDLIIDGARRYEVQDPHDGGFNWWESTLVEVFDE